MTIPGSCSGHPLPAGWRWVRRRRSSGFSEKNAVSVPEKKAEAASSTGSMPSLI